MKYTRNQRCVLILSFLVLSFCGHAQNPVEISLSLSKGTNDATSLNRLGIGGMITAKHAVNSKGMLRLSFGYDWFGVQREDDKSQAYRDSIARFGVNRSLLFLRVGYQHFLTNRLFIFADGGLSDRTLWSEQLRFGSKLALSYDAGFGYRFRLDDKNSVVGSFAFNGNYFHKTSVVQYDLNYVSLHIGYEFSPRVSRK